MVRLALVLLFFIFLPFLSPGQKEYGAISTNRDTAAIMSDIRSAKTLVNTNSDSLLEVLHAAYLSSKNILFARGTIAALHTMGFVYENRGAYDTALNRYKEALAYAERLHDSDKVIPSILNNMGITYSHLGNFEQTTKCYERALQVTEKYLAELGERHPGYHDLIKAYNAVYINLVKQLLDLGQLEQVMVYIDKAEQYAVETGNYYFLGHLMVSKGTYYNQKGNWEQAEHYMRQALNIGQTHRIVSVEHLALLDLGIIYTNNGKLDQAKACLLKAKSIKGEINTVNENTALLALGRVYVMLKDYENARTILNTALTQAEALNLSSNLVQIHEILAQYYTRSGRFRQALTHTQKYIALKDSFANQQVQDNLNALEVRYRTAEKDKEITNKQLTIARQEESLAKKNTWITGALAGIILLSALFISLYRSYRHKQHIRDREIRILKQEQQFLMQERKIDRLKTLMEGEEKERARIARDLHDGIAAQLAAVRLNFSQVQKEHRELKDGTGFRSALQQLDDVAAELRKTAHNLMPEILLQKGLAEAVYIFCEKTGKNGVLEINFQCPNPIPRLNPELELSIYRMIQELVHNIIKHAEATTALIQLNCFEDLLSITIEDNGKGIDKNALNKSKGTGLKTITARALTLNGHADIQSKETGTTVYLEFDLVKQNDPEEAMKITGDE